MTSNMLSILAEPVLEAKASMLNTQEIETYPGVFFLSRFDRLLHRIRCGERFWSRPFTVRRRGYVYPNGFNAHQVCLECGIERHYDSRDIRFGRPFRRSR